MICVTGGSGFVGQNLLEALHGAKAPSRRDLDLEDFACVKKWFERHQPELVVHAAGLTGGIAAQRNCEFLDANWQMGRNVVHAARKTGSKLINIASSCMYPPSDKLLREDDLLSGPLEPTNEGYGLAKAGVTRMCQWSGFKTIVPCNLYGPHDHYKGDKAHLVAAALSKTTSGCPVTIWGSGKARREFMYVRDLSGLILDAIERYDTLPDVMNAGTGVDHSVDEIYALAARVTGYSGGFTHDRSKPDGAARKCLDVTRARKWGWSATTPLEEGMAACTPVMGA